MEDFEFGLYLCERGCYHPRSYSCFCICHYKSQLAIPEELPEDDLPDVTSTREALKIMWQKINIILKHLNDHERN